jgi:hypothetical protein
MLNLLDWSFWHETNQESCRPSPPDQLVDMEDGHAVLDFTYYYLQTHSRPPSDGEVRNVTAAIARYKGPQVVPWAILELFLAGLVVMERA